MTATNHTLTGALIVGAVANPLVALPLALGSHFVLDALPHYGGAISHTTTKYKFILATDCLMAASVLSLIVITRPEHWVLMFLCAVVAASPDLLWLPYWIDDLKGKPRELSKLARFLGWIQWAEKPWGWPFELAWFSAAGYVLIKVVTKV